MSQSMDGRRAVLGNLYRACHAVSIGTADHSVHSMVSDSSYTVKLLCLHQEKLSNRDRMFKIGFHGVTKKQGFGWDEMGPQIQVSEIK